MHTYLHTYCIYICKYRFQPLPSPALTQLDLEIFHFGCIKIIEWIPTWMEFKFFIYFFPGNSEKLHCFSGIWVHTALLLGITEFHRAFSTVWPPPRVHNVSIHCVCPSHNMLLPGPLPPPTRSPTKEIRALTSAKAFSSYQCIIIIKFANDSCRKYTG